jgi:transcriptional regulator with XRE-family HTH domain
MRLILKQQRNKLGFTQEEVAKLSEMTRSYYGHIENGRKQNLSIEDMEVIAKALRIKPELKNFKIYCDNMEQNTA